MSASEPVEIELKLMAYDAARLAELPRVLYAVADEVRPEIPSDYRDFYLDTPDWRLYRAGFGCRARYTPKGAVLTMKAVAPIENGWASRCEIEEALEGDAAHPPRRLPEGRVAKRFGPVVGDAPLEVKVELRKRHSAYHVVAGDVAVEASADEVHVIGTGSERDFAEIELELERGDAEAFRALAESVRQRLSLAPSDASKFARGLEMAGVAPPALLEGDELRIRPGDRLIDAAHKVLRRHFDRLLWNEPGTRLGLDPECLHDMRVASRRMLAALRVFGEALPPRRAKALGEEVKWVARQLGQVRDLDVSLARIQEEIAQLGPDAEEALRSYQDHLLAERRKARARMLRALDSKRFARFAGRMGRFLGAGPPRRPAATLARRPVRDAAQTLIRSLLKKFLREGRRLDRDSAAEVLHGFRKRCKMMRYACEFFSDVYGKPALRVARRVVAVQDALGEHQDACVANENLRRFAVDHPAPRGRRSEALLTLGRLMARREMFADTCRDAFAKAWKRLDRKKTLGPLKKRMDKIASDAPPAPTAPKRRPAPKPARPHVAVVPAPKRPAPPQRPERHDAPAEETPGSGERPAVNC